MLKIFKVEGCCGVWELDGVSTVTPAQALETVRDASNMILIPHIFFTQATRLGDVGTDREFESYGHALRNYIKRHRLGNVYASERAVNPNSGNYVTGFWWTPDWSAVHAHRD